MPVTEENLRLSFEKVRTDTNELKDQISYLARRIGELEVILDKLINEAIKPKKKKARKKK